MGEEEQEKGAGAETAGANSQQACSGRGLGAGSNKPLSRYFTARRHRGGAPCASELRTTGYRMGGGVVRPRYAGAGSRLRAARGTSGVIVRPVCQLPAGLRPCTMHLCMRHAPGLRAACAYVRGSRFPFPPWEWERECGVLRSGRPPGRSRPQPVSRVQPGLPQRALRPANEPPGAVAWGTGLCMEPGRCLASGALVFEIMFIASLPWGVPRQLLTLVVLPLPNLPPDQQTKFLYSLPNHGVHLS
jgi:hypothetical protein